MEDKNRNILIREDQIKETVQALGRQISEEYKEKNLYVLSLLRGSFIFTADLVREIDIPTQIGFMTTSSYGHSENTSGLVKIITDISDNITGLDVLVVDDIIDTGITMDFVINYVKKLGAATVKSCVLLDKPERRKIEVKPDYCCFKIPDLFVVGYGLNFGQFYRNIPYIFNWQTP